MSVRELQAFLIHGGIMDKITAKMDGQKRIYLDERGDKIDTCKEAIDSIIVINLDPLKQFIEIALEGEPEDERPLLVMQTLLARAEEKIYAATEFIRDHYGEIEIEKARYGQCVIPETMLGVVFKPCDVKKQAAA
jgi:hypothetical protein